MIQTDVSSMVPYVDIPQGQEILPEAKSGALVAGRGQLLGLGEEEQLHRFCCHRFCCPTISILLDLGGFLGSL